MCSLSSGDHQTTRRFLSRKWGPCLGIATILRTPGLTREYAAAMVGLEGNIEGLMWSLKPFKEPEGRHELPHGVSACAVNNQFANSSSESLDGPPQSRGFQSNRTPKPEGG